MGSRGLTRACEDPREGLGHPFGPNFRSASVRCFFFLATITRFATERATCAKWRSPLCSIFRSNRGEHLAPRLTSPRQVSSRARPQAWEMSVVGQEGHSFSPNFRSAPVRCFFFSRRSRDLLRNVRRVENGDDLSVQFFAITDASISRRDLHCPDRLAHGAAPWAVDHMPSWRHDSDSCARRRRNDGAMTAASQVCFFTRTPNVSPGNQWWK